MSSHTYQFMWLLIHAGIRINQRYLNGPLVFNAYYVDVSNHAFLAKYSILDCHRTGWSKIHITSILVQDWHVIFA